MAGFPPFSWLNNIPLCVCVYTLQVFYTFIVGRHLTCFPILAVAENVVVSTGVHAPLGNPAFRVHGEVESLRRMVALVLLLEEAPSGFQQWLLQDFHTVSAHADSSAQAFFFRILPGHVGLRAQPQRPSSKASPAALRHRLLAPSSEFLLYS